MASQYGPLFLQLAKEQQEKNEANAKAHTFDVGKIAGGLLTSILTANPTPLLLSAGGEGLRASTGSSIDISSLASQLGQQYLPQNRTNLPEGPKMQDGSYYTNPIQESLSKIGTMPSSPMGNIFTNPNNYYSTTEVGADGKITTKYTEKTPLDKYYASLVGDAGNMILTGVTGGKPNFVPAINPDEVPAGYKIVNNKLVKLDKPTKLSEGDKKRIEDLAESSRQWSQIGEGGTLKVNGHIVKKQQGMAYFIK